MSQMLQMAQVFVSKSGSNIGCHVAQIFIDIHTGEMAEKVRADGKLAPIYAQPALRQRREPEGDPGVAGAQRHQHHQQYLYTSGFFQQGFLCQCHRQHFPGEHKGMICNKNKAARNLKKVRTAYLVPMVGLEPTWFPERF